MNKDNTYIVEEPQRLDLFLTQKLEQTRNQIALLIKQDSIEVDNKKVKKPGLKLKVGQQVKVDLPTQKETPALEVNFEVEVLFEDDDLMVINKPSGVTVHGAPSVKEATLVDWLKRRGVRLSTISGEERHGIVHRLDKGTSGTMVIAKNNEAHEALSAQLQDKTMGRYYLAIIDPPLKDEVTIIDKAIGRSASNRLKMACVESAKSAKTEFRKVLFGKNEDVELIACKLYTGRTHQIRVHLESMSRHILGDHIYGTSKKDSKTERILLHAYVLYFTHPTTKKLVSFVAPVADEIKEEATKYFDMEKFNEVVTENNITNIFNTDTI
ncbi:MAG: RluA family pseudouridine synthase [Helicobacteraceae bacterium]|nr:RluA family pseudouridine synthase [Helicobacteraceae bacterium]